MCLIKLKIILSEKNVLMHQALGSFFLLENQKMN